MTFIYLIEGYVIVRDFIKEDPMYGIETTITVEENNPKVNVIIY